MQWLLPPGHLFPPEQSGFWLSYREAKHFLSEPNCHFHMCRGFSEAFSAATSAQSNRQCLVSVWGDILLHGFRPKSCCCCFLSCGLFIKSYKKVKCFCLFAIKLSCTIWRHHQNTRDKVHFVSTYFYMLKIWIEKRMFVFYETDKWNYTEWSFEDKIFLTSQRWWGLEHGTHWTLHSGEIQYFVIFHLQHQLHVAATHYAS